MDNTIKDKTMIVIVSISLFGCLIWGAATVEQSKYKKQVTNTIEENTIAKSVNTVH